MQIFPLILIDHGNPYIYIFTLKFGKFPCFIFLLNLLVHHHSILKTPVDDWWGFWISTLYILGTIITGQSHDEDLMKTWSFTMEIAIHQVDDFPKTPVKNNLTVIYPAANWHGFPVKIFPKGHPISEEAEELRQQVVECQLAGQKLQLDSEVPMVFFLNHQSSTNAGLP